MKKLLHKIKVEIKSIIYGVKNIIIWIPIIYQDRHWDYSFLFTIMIKKLELMEEFYADESNTCCADARVYAEDIHNAVAELKYIADGKFDEEAYKPLHDKHMEKYGEYTLENVLESANAPKPEGHSEWIEGMVKESDRLYNEHMDEFCRIFKEKVRYWWD